ncbi:MAG: tRNA-dihydrouridine synthase [Candidatus Paceibacterota bacterium]|jgi:tRNA-dihydrouridine synthase
MNKRQIKSFWQELPKPFFALAPMANVTDFAFREMIAKYGKPNVMWTEFVSADGLMSSGRDRLLIDLKFSKKQKPIVAQLFGSNPEKMREAVRLVCELGFDGVDINMGCPDRSVEKGGGGASMMKDPKRAIEIIYAARSGWVSSSDTSCSEPNRWGAPSSARRSGLVSPPDTFTPRANRTPLVRLAPRSVGGADQTQSVTNNVPISVKTRLGYNKIDMDWIRLLLEQRLPALTVHLRTRKEMSEVGAHWDMMPEIVKLRDKMSPETLIIGNGDVVSVEDGIVKAKQYGCDGIMIGRGIFGKPWLFEDLQDLGRPRRRRRQVSNEAKPNVRHFVAPRRGRPSYINSSKSPKERLKIMLEHAKLFEKTFKGMKNFDTMKKHFKAYVSGWDGAKELRIKLMGANDYDETKKIVINYLLSNSE